MTERKDSEASAPIADTPSAASAPPAPAVVAEQTINLAEPARVEAPAAEPLVAVPAIEMPAPVELPGAIEMPRPIEVAMKPVGMPKPIEMPRPVEIAMKAVEAMRPLDRAKPRPAPDKIVAPAVPPPAASLGQAVAGQARSGRFALLAASVAFASAIGALVGALTAASVTRGPAQTPLAAIDLTSVQDSIAALRTELSSVKSSVESSTRSSTSQFAKFTERLERIDRTQAAPAAQLKQAMEAIERLERRAQANGQAVAETTGSIRIQQAAAPVQSEVIRPPEPIRPQVLDGWVVRHVSRGVAIIQGRRMGTIEVETGDVVPGVGRIESIRRQDGRWVVVTSKGVITSPQPR